MSRPAPEWLDAAAAARMMRVERSTVWRYVSSGRLKPDAKFGRAPVFHVDTIRAYIDGMPVSARRAFERRAELFR